MILLSDTTFIIKSNKNFNYTVGTICYDKYGIKTNADIRIIDSWSDVHRLKNLKKYLFLANGGLLFLDIYSFFDELSKLPKNTGYGHIINHKPEEYYLHESSIFLRSEKLPSTFGTDTMINFPKLQRSIENIHSSYTPLYVKLHSDGTYFSHKQLFGQDIIKKYVEEQSIFLNFSNKCRQYKTYIYDSNNYNFENFFPEYKKIVEHTLWIFNNTPFKEIKGAKVAMVPSGLAWIVQLLKIHNCNIDLYDISLIQLKFAQELLETWQGHNYGDFVYNFIIKNKVRTWIIPNLECNLKISAQEQNKKNIELIKNKESFINLVNLYFDSFLKTHFYNLNFISLWKCRKSKQINFYNKDILGEYYKYHPDAIWATNITQFKYNILKHSFVKLKNFKEYIENKKRKIDTPTLYFTKKIEKLKKKIKKKTILPIASNIIDHSRLPCLKLDIDIPHEHIFKEIKNIENYFVNHRASESYGWQSFCIHGKSYDSTEDSTVLEDSRPYTWTKEAELLLPFTVDYFKNKFPYQQYKRLRIMKLLPGGFIRMHRDYEKSKLSPINIAINNPKKNKFYLEKWGVVEFEPGSSYMLDLSNYHAVHNESKENRYHIIVHGKMNKHMEEIIVRSYKMV